MFNAASKTAYTVAVAAVAAGFIYVAIVGDRNGLTLLVFAGAAALAVGLTAFALVGPDPIETADELETAEARPADTTDLAAPSWWPLAAAVTLGILAGGAALGAELLVPGVILAVVVLFAWFAQAWREHPSWTQAMTDRINQRFVAPIGIPGMVIVFVGLGAVAFSRLLLAVTKEGAAIVTLVVASAILAACFVIASARNVGRTALAVVSSVGVALVVASGVAGALLGERHFEHHGPDEGGHEGFYVVEIEEDEPLFAKQVLQLPALTEIELVVENHNDDITCTFAIYEDAQAREPLFRADPVGPGEEETFGFVTPDSGSYHFQCDEDPEDLEGDVLVAEEASAEEKPGDPPIASTTTTTPG